MTFKIETLGCKVNQYESQLIFEELIDAGLTVSEDNPEVVIINSCTVTSEADSKTLKLARRIKKNHPSCLLVLTGCFPQVSPEEAKIPEADIIIGGRDKEKVIKAILDHIGGSKNQGFIHSEFNPKDLINQKGAKGFEEHTRAFMKIQEGCNRYCSYCIIPKARGPLRHKSKAAIIAEVTSLVAKGYKEIVLVGINLAMYGFNEDMDLADAVFAAASVDGDFRIRLGSTEPELMTDELLLKLKSCDKFCRSFHLPLQSGSDITLKEMNRRYTTEEFRNRVLAVRKLFGDNVGISTDIMVGFPGESDEEAKNSADFFREMAFSDAHIFIYSPREGTVAAARKDQVPQQIKDKRSKALIEIAKTSREAYLKSRVGSISEVIIQKSQNSGYDEFYCPVKLDDDIKFSRGSKIKVQIIDSTLNNLFGKPCEGV